MALCRCLNHLPPPRYLGYAEPVGYPLTSSICGRNNCNEPGYIWLKEGEINNFNQGNRVFEFATNSTKVEIGNQFTERD